MKKTEKDRRKVVVIAAVIAAVIIILLAATGRKWETDPVLDPTPSAETTAPAAKKTSKSPKPSYPTKGKFEEDILPRDEAEEAVTKGALTESSVGDMESKKYNSYSLEKDLQLAGPEQSQEVASHEEVTEALTVSSSTPAPTSTPVSAVQQAAEAASEQKQTADNAAADAQKAAAEAEAAAKAKAEAEAKAAQAAAEAQQRAYEEAQAAAEAQQSAEAAAQAAKDQEIEAERARICESSGGSYEHGACAYQQDDIEVISVESEASAEASPAAE